MRRAPGAPQALPHLFHLAAHRVRARCRAGRGSAACCACGSSSYRAVRARGRNGSAASQRRAPGRRAPRRAGGTAARRRRRRPTWQVRAGAYALAHVTSTRKNCAVAAARGAHAAKNRVAEGVLVACIGVCVTERGTHLLGNAWRQEPAPALLCALARHLGQFDRVGGLERTQATSRHPRAAVVPWLRAPAVTARLRVRAWRRLGGRPWCL